LAAWVSDPKVLNLMRDVVMAANRLEHRGSRPEVSDREVIQLRRELDEAADAYEEALANIGWRVPGARAAV
jgi:hypothetical protein